jgi:hypothetical protein
MTRTGGCRSGGISPLPQAVLEKTAFPHFNNTFTPHAEILLIGRDLSKSSMPSNHLIDSLYIIFRQVNHVEGSGP